MQVVPATISWAGTLPPPHSVNNCSRSWMDLRTLQNKRTKKGGRGPQRLISSSNSLASRVHNFAIWTKFITMNVGNTNKYYAFTFALSDLPTDTEVQFQNLFRMYRIDRIDLSFRPKMRTVTASDWVLPAGPAAFNSTTSVAICYDDAVAPASENDVLSFENATLHQTIGEPWTVSFRPRAKLDTNNVNSVPLESPWIDTANVGVSHYGVKICVPLIGGPNQDESGIDIYARYHLSFRTVC